MISSTVSRVHHQTILPWGSRCLKTRKTNSRGCQSTKEQRTTSSTHKKKTEHCYKTKRFIIQIKQILPLKAIFNLVF